MLPSLEPYLQSELPWVRWAVTAWVQRRPVDDPERIRAHRETLEHPLLRAQLEAVLDWPWPPMKNHKQAKHPLHRLGLLVELGLTSSDPEGERIAANILAHQGEDGAFRLVAEIPKAFGGSGQPEWIWMGCDTPLLLEALAAMGLSGDERLERAATQLAALVRDEGWPCATGPGMRGPGRKGDPCPYANLLSLRALSRLPVWRDSHATRRGTEMLLGHWERRSERKLYLFGIGTDYAKPKYPLVWYDRLHALEVLSRFPWVHRDPRFLEQLALLRAAAGPDGAYKPTTVWMAYKGFDFAQKRGPSPTLALAVERIERRVA